MKTRAGTLRKIAPAAPETPSAPTLSDADCLAKFASMTPTEQALTMVRATPAQRLTPYGLQRRPGLP